MKREVAMLPLTRDSRRPHGRAIRATAPPQPSAHAYDRATWGAPTAGSHLDVSCVCVCMCVCTYVHCVPTVLCCTADAVRGIQLLPITMVVGSIRGHEWLPLGPAAVWKMTVRSAERHCVPAMVKK